MAYQIKCPHCSGTGEIRLTGVYAETMDIIRRYRPGTFVVAGQDWKRFNAPSATALNNRLAALEKHGLLTSKRYGRQRRFRLA